MNETYIKSQISRYSEKNSLALASALGTAIEFYDFTLFGVFSTILSEVFYPKLQIEFTLIIFASSFFMRPIGALIFGSIGDKKGRKHALTLTIILMSIPTFIIGILPSYDSIGVAAPILLIICRLTQGIFAGGEHNGAAVYVIENWPPERSGMASSIIIAGVFSGVFFAVIAGVLVSNLSTMSFAWRIPFILGIIIGSVGFYIRRNLSENKHFSGNANLYSKNKTTVYVILSKHLFSLLSTVTLGGLAGIVGYTIAVYLTIHLNLHIGLSLQLSTFISAICIFFAFTTSIFVGKISDIYSPISIMFASTIIITCTIYPIYACLHTSTLYVLISASALLGILTGFYCSPIHAVISRMFPVEVRYTGTSLGYSLGMCIFGGTTPLISNWLIHNFHFSEAPALYVIVFALVTSFVLFIWKQKWFNKNA